MGLLSRFLHRQLFDQQQSMRDAIFAALTLHIFYKNSDIVEFAMETQLSNLLQSLFETDGEKFYKTPTFYIMKLLKEHTGQYLLPVLPDDIDDDLDAVATISEDGKSATVSIVNRHLYEARDIDLQFSKDDWSVIKADIVTCENVRDVNTFEDPERIRDYSFDVSDYSDIQIPKHSVVRICFEKK